MHPWVNIAMQAARAASRPMLRAFDRGDDIKFDEKSTNDFVSAIDFEAQRCIIDVIRERYPNHQILAEEVLPESLSDAESEETVKPAPAVLEDVCWIIDPLDGTRNFLNGLPHFAISIAVKHKGQMEVGLVYDPIRQEAFIATKGEGARLNDHRIRVSDTKRFSQALIGTGFPFKTPKVMPAYMNSFAKILPRCADIRRPGCASLDLAYVACGRYDGFWEFGLKPWDTAAGALIVQEAGGIVTDFNNGLGFNDNESIIAGNPAMHEELLGMIGQVKWP